MQAFFVAKMNRKWFQVAQTIASGYDQINIFYLWFPENIAFQTLAPSSPQTLESGLKRNKLICTSESERKDQIGDFDRIFVTLLYKK